MLSNVIAVQRSEGQLGCCSHHSFCKMRHYVQQHQQTPRSLHPSPFCVLSLSFALRRCPVGPTDGSARRAGGNRAVWGRVFPRHGRALRAAGLPRVLAEPGHKFWVFLSAIYWSFICFLIVRTYYVHENESVKGKFICKG